MNRIFLVVVLSIVATFSTAFAQSRVDDSGRYQIAIIGKANEAPATWFESDPNLKALKSRVMFNVLDKSSELYKQRYAGLVSGPDPVLLFERPDGGIVYAAARDSLPTTPPALHAAMQEHYRLAEGAQPATQAFAPEQCPDVQCDPYGQCGPDGCGPDGQCRVPLLNRDRDGFAPLKPFADEVTKRGGFCQIVDTGALVAIGLILLFVFIIGGIVLFSAFAFFLYVFRMFTNGNR